MFNPVLVEEFFVRVMCTTVEQFKLFHFILCIKLAPEHHFSELIVLKQLKRLSAAHICLSDCSLLLQSHRHEIHKSHNKAAAQWELREKALQRRFRHAGSPAPLDKASLSIIREVCATSYC